MQRIFLSCFLTSDKTHLCTIACVNTIVVQACDGVLTDIKYNYLLLRLHRCCYVWEKDKTSRSIASIDNSLYCCFFCLLFHLFFIVVAEEGWFQGQGSQATYWFYETTLNSNVRSLDADVKTCSSFSITFLFLLHLKPMCESSWL